MPLQCTKWTRDISTLRWRSAPSFCPFCGSPNHPVFGKSFLLLVCSFLSHNTHFNSICNMCLIPTVTWFEFNSPASTVKTAFHDLFGQQPPTFYDRNSLHGSLCTEKSLWWMTTCRTQPATARFCPHRAIRLQSVTDRHQPCFRLV